MEEFLHIFQVDLEQIEGDTQIYSCFRKQVKWDFQTISDPSTVVEQLQV